MPETPEIGMAEGSYMTAKRTGSPLLLSRVMFARPSAVSLSLRERPLPSTIARPVVSMPSSARVEVAALRPPSQVAGWPFAMATWRKSTSATLFSDSRSITRTASAAVFSAI